jgi:hypothetical protein
MGGFGNIGRSSTFATEGQEFVVDLFFNLVIKTRVTNQVRDDVQR